MGTSYRGIRKERLWDYLKTKGLSDCKELLINPKKVSPIHYGTMVVPPR